MFWWQITLVGLLAAGTTYLTMFRDMDDILGGFAGMFLWLMFSYGNLNVETVVEGTGVVSSTYESLSYLGLALAAIMLVVAIYGSGQILNVMKDNVDV